VRGLTPSVFEPPHPQPHSPKGERVGAYSSYPQVKTCGYSQLAPVGANGSMLILALLGRCPRPPYLSPWGIVRISSLSVASKKCGTCSARGRRRRQAIPGNASVSGVNVAGGYTASAGMAA
jgi:hypothetical protein